MVPVGARYEGVIFSLWNLKNLLKVLFPKL
nr:MAG TPA: DNA fragmentation factor 40 kDa [Caudoviricetes sp.]DAZ00760.1 MAG TPA: DNA fragmentation factor 40 kDa [Caudoviricetes sp.]